MKGRIISGRGLSGLSRYVNKPDAEHVDGSCHHRDFLRTCAGIRSQRPDVRQASIHISISMPPDQPLTPDQWRAAGQILMREMQMQDLEYQIVRHHDTGHDHCHLIACKIRADGSLWNDSHSARRLHRACEKIEQEMNLQHTLTVKEHRDQNRPKPMSDGALRQFQRTGAVPDKTKEAIQRRIKNERERADRTAHQKANGTAGAVISVDLREKNPAVHSNVGTENKGAGGSAEPINNKQNQGVADMTDENRTPCFFAPRRTNRTRPLPPTLNNKLENRAADKVKNGFDLFWRGRDQPTFRWHSDSGEIQLLAKPTRKNVEALFDLAREQQMPEPLEVHGSKDFQIMAAREAFARGLKIDVENWEARQLIKNLTAEKFATDAANAAGAAESAKKDEQKRLKKIIDEQDREKAAQKSNRPQMRMWKET